MPELPEVEHTRRRLAEWLENGRIARCVVHDARIVRPASKAAFEKAVLGRTVTRVERRGKWLRLTLSDERRVFSHLAMTGWFEHAKDETPLRFERVRLTIAHDGGPTVHVAYVDARRWGQLITAKDDIPSWTMLGPDAMNEPLDATALHALLERRRKSTIKEAIMDQRLMAGVGNIQAAEALWKAEIDPRSIAAAVTLADVRAILRGIQWTMKRTLLDLEKGENGKDDPFLIYGHVGMPCPRCKTLLHRMELGGRTTTFCPGCQRRVKKLPRR